MFFFSDFFPSNPDFFEGTRVMPHLVNGIGTWYIGKNNHKKELGRCEFCGFRGNLSTYETRLWFLVIFIPVIPLGKKQILDECPSCRRHRLMPLAKWKELEAKALREKMQQAEANPDDPIAMLQLHGTMVGFHRTQDALQLAEVLKNDFPDSLDVQMHLGTWHASEGRVDQARPFFRRALELAPDNLFAKQMVALECIDQGDLPRARELLRGMDEPGANQAPKAMLALANAYQSQGDHANALEIYRTTLEMVPAFAQDKSLRKQIRASEEALGQTESLLPKRKRKLGKLYAFAAVAALVLLGAWGINFYKAKNQPLFIINGLNQPLRVSIDGGATIELAAMNHQDVDVAEGVHHALVQQAGEPDETIEFKVENEFFERYSGRSAFVLNPKGAGVVIWKKIDYYPKGQNPNVNAMPVYRIHFGEKSFVFRDIDYAFTQPPKEIQLKAHAVESKYALAILSEDPHTILNMFLPGTSVEELANFVESQLPGNPNDSVLLREYLNFRAEAKQLDRCREFLAGRLAKRPVSIEWQRSYQQVCEITGHAAELEPQYRKMLEADPKNSALLYLLGRVTADRKQQHRYFEQALEADPKNAYPQYALAYDYVSLGDFSKAEPLAREACLSQPEQLDMESLFYDIRFALKEYAPLEKELKEKEAAKPYHLDNVVKLMQVQAAAGAIDRARATQSDYAQRFEQFQTIAGNSEAFRLAILSKLSLLYLENDFEGILKESSALREPQQIDGVNFQAHLEMGNIEAAERALPLDPSGKASEAGAMLLSLAWSQKGDAAKAGEWRKKAAETLRTGSDEEKQAAAMLESGKVDLEEVSGLTLGQTHKAIWLVALADVSPDHRKELLDYAEKLNTDTYFPHRFLKQTIEKMRKP